LGNHDKFRFASRIGSEQARVATMLLLTLRGSPTWYYGDEIGMLNGEIPPDKIVDPRGIRQPDVPSEQRDPERTPMQWDGTTNGGFSNTEPWLPVSADYTERNVAEQERQPQSTLNLVKHLLKLRKEHKALSQGSYVALSSYGKDKHETEETSAVEDGLFIYLREFDGERIAVVLNFTDTVKSHKLQGRLLASTYMDHESLNNKMYASDKNAETSTTISNFRVRPNEGIALLLI
jgi:alpha-glucosidase